MRQRVHRALLAPVEGHAEGLGGGADVPQHFGVVATGVTPVRQRGRIGQLCLGVRARPQDRLRRVHGSGGMADPGIRHRKQQIAHLVVALTGDELPHDSEASTSAHRATVRRQVSGDDPQQRGLAGPVGADQGGLGPFPDPERDLVQQHPAVRSP